MPQDAAGYQRHGLEVDIFICCFYAGERKANLMRDNCASMSVLQSARMKGENAIEKSKEIFERTIQKNLHPRDEKGRFVKAIDPASDISSEVSDGNRPAVVPV